MKLSMKITERDKKLLSILGIVVVGALFYFFALEPLYNGMASAESENQRLNSKYNELKGFETHLNANREKYDKQKLEYMALSRQLPNNLTEKYVIADTYNITKQVLADAESYSFTPRTDIKSMESVGGDESSAAIKGLYSYGATTNWKLGYGELKRLIKLSEKFESVFILDNLSITPEEGGKLNLSFAINFIGYDDEKAPLRVFNGLNLPTGKSIIFAPAAVGGAGGSPEVAPTPPSSGGSTSPNTSLGTNGSITQIDKNKDFVLALSTTASPTSSVVIEKSGDSKNIFGGNKSFENAEINLKGKGGKYQYSMATSKDRFPLTGLKEFKPNSKDIVLLIYSTGRKGETDKNVINIKINNETDKKVYAYVIGDDTKLPRCSITKGGSNVYVEKR
ncbi:MAG: hypothetical protein RR840_08580 [Clostridium sp.]